MNDVESQEQGENTAVSRMDIKENICQMFKYQKT